LPLPTSWHASWNTKTVPNYRDEAVVLRTYKLGEVDRIVTLLTRNHGQVRAVAKGIRKTSSRFGGRLEPFTVVDLQLYEGKNLDTVSQVDQVASYGREIIASFPSYTAASAIVEAAERLTREESSERHYLLVVGALRALSKGEQGSDVILDSFLLRMLAISGWVPALDVCSSCGSEPESFSVHTGSVHCASCPGAGSVKLGQAGLDHMKALLAGDWPVVVEVTKTTKDSVSGVIAAYMQWQLERGLKSLSFVERA
jgi:DNA repair protein RecO (recombination protein O)